MFSVAPLQVFVCVCVHARARLGHNKRQHTQLHKLGGTHGGD